MKKLISILCIGIIAFATSSFNKPLQTSYGSWKNVSCFKGIDFCVKKTSYNEYAKKYEWWVKFRNRYQTTVHFNYTAKESYVSSAKTSSRITIRSGGEGDNWFLIADANSINVFVDNLRFGENDFGDYARCDQ